MVRRLAHLLKLKTFDPGEGATAEDTTVEDETSVFIPRKSTLSRIAAGKNAERRSKATLPYVQGQDAV